MDVSQPLFIALAIAIPVAAIILLIYLIAKLPSEFDVVVAFFRQFIVEFRDLLKK